MGTAHMPFALENAHTTYLGIKVGREPSSLYYQNYPPLIAKIIQELDMWANLPLPLMGRAHLIKMISFARLRFPLQTLPFLLKRKDVNRINMAMQSFLWKEKRARIHIQKLYLLKVRGIRAPKY